VVAKPPLTSLRQVANEGQTLLRHLAPRNSLSCQNNKLSGVFRRPARGLSPQRPFRLALYLAFTTLLHDTYAVKSASASDAQRAFTADQS